MGRAEGNTDIASGTWHGVKPSVDENRDIYNLPLYLHAPHTLMYCIWYVTHSSIVMSVDNIIGMISSL